MKTKPIDRLFVVLPPLSSLGPSAYLKRSTAESTLLSSRMVYGRSQREIVEFVRAKPALSPKPKAKASSRATKKKPSLSRVKPKKVSRK